MGYGLYGERRMEAVEDLVYTVVDEIAAQVLVAAAHEVQLEG
jgi:hypothetical protein